jgi:hypothetical protein
MPDRWADDLPRCRAAGIPAGLELPANRSSRCASWAGWPTPTPPWICKGGMMALVALRDAAAKVFRLTTAGQLIAVFRTVAEAAARD